MHFVQVAARVGASKSRIIFLVLTSVFNIEACTLSLRPPHTAADAFSQSSIFVSTPQRFSASSRLERAPIPSSMTTMTTSVRMAAHSTSRFEYQASRIRLNVHSHPQPSPPPSSPIGNPQLSTPAVSIAAPFHPSPSHLNTSTVPTYLNAHVNASSLPHPHYLGLSLHSVRASHLPAASGTLISQLSQLSPCRD